MYCKGEFAGTIVINGNVVAESVSVFVAEHYLSIRKGDDRYAPFTELSVHPFTKFMLFTQDEQLMSDGFFYEVSGTRIGAWSYGPRGHPGDGERDIRPLCHIRTDVSFFIDRISVSLSGKTEEGSDGFNPEKVIAPWEFTVTFDIPRVEMQSFFNFGEPAGNRIFGLMDALSK